MAKNNFYGVKVGLVAGVYDNWPECQANVKGVPGAIYKGFPTEEEAYLFVGDKSKQITVPVGPVSTVSSDVSIQAALDLFSDTPLTQNVSVFNSYSLNLIDEETGEIMATVNGAKNQLEYFASTLISVDVEMGLETAWETSTLMLGDNTYKHSLNIKGYFPKMENFIQPVTFGSKGPDVS